MPGTGEASLPAQLSLPSEDVLHSEGLTSASLDEEGRAEQATGHALPVRRLPSFALPERQLSSTQDPSREAHAATASAKQRSSTAFDAGADPLGATGSVGRRSTKDSPLKQASHGPISVEDGSLGMPGWSPSRSSAGSSPARHLAAPTESAPPSMSLHAGSAAQPAVQPLQDGPSVSLGAVSSSHPDDSPDEGSSSSRAAEAPVSPNDSASAGIRALTREISELAYVDRDPYGSPMRRYRATDDAEEHHANAAVEAESDASAWRGPEQGNDDVESRPEEDRVHEAEHLAPMSSPEQDAGQREQDTLNSLADDVGD